MERLGKQRNMSLGWLSLLRSHKQLGLCHVTYLLPKWDNGVTDWVWNEFVEKNSSYVSFDISEVLAYHFINIHIDYPYSDSRLSIYRYLYSICIYEYQQWIYIYEDISMFYFYRSIDIRYFPNVDISRLSICIYYSALHCVCTVFFLINYRSMYDPSSWRKWTFVMNSNNFFFSIPLNVQDLYGFYLK